ncbi:MAG: cytochrome C [Gammaproteobacteria bacterium]|jgi:cytochrome c
MSKKVIAAAMVAALGLGASSLANAADIKAMMQEHGCFACHADAAKIVGPAYGWIAYKYKDKKGAVKMLADKIRAGGAGVWNAYTGGVPMPAHPQISLADAEAMAKWVLSQPAIKPPAQ